MAQLKNSASETLLTDLNIADRMWSRMRGLLGTSSLSGNEGLWIHRCNSIHTFFMSYVIDCIFVDSSLRIKALKPEVQPWRLVTPILGATSVFEVQSGQIEKWKLSVGDQLHVGS